jgi:hypothetical protein
MQNTIPTQGTISWGRRLMPAAAALGLLLVFAFAQSASAQTASVQNPLVTTACSTTSLCLDNTYIVSGDYVVGSVGLQGLGDASGLATGTINIPDCVQATAMKVPCPTPPVVPSGADIVLAQLIWETVESTSGSATTGQHGFFNGYPITGAPVGIPSSSWSSGGCSGNSMGAKVIKTYSADVRPFLPLDMNGNIQANGSFQVRLKDSGSNGNTTPHTPGATLLIIYRVVSTIGSMRLNAVVIYDGVVAPTTTSSPFSQPIVGFYQAAASPMAKMTIIAGYGQTNKTNLATLNSTNLPALYPDFPNDAFPGALYPGGSWDSPTWTGANALIINEDDFMETAGIVPAPQNGSCVDVAAVVFSTLVKDKDGDGLLDRWEAPPPNLTNPNGTSPGYIDAKSGQFVALPGADPNVKDIFFEVDYLQNLDGKAGTYLHSHLLKQQAMDMVGNAFKNAPIDCDPVTKVCQGVKVHFDLGLNSKGHNIYPGDPYVISYPDPLPQGATVGGNAISESAVLCTGATCQFPSTPSSTPPVFEPTVSWKGGFIFVRDTPCASSAGLVVDCSTTGALHLGNFQPGRGLSYRYLLSGHFLGEPRSSWTTEESALSIPSIPQLVSIVNSGTTATVTLQSPPGVFKPGDCTSTPSLVGCSDNNLERVSIAGALGQPALNGTYIFNNAQSGPPDANGVITTTFTIATTNTTPNTTPPCLTAPCVADGSYTFSNESQLGVAYAGPTLTSGHSDFRGGGDAAVTLAWPEDDPLMADGVTPNCQADPSQPLGLFPAYCNNQLGSALQQAGTILHEGGHDLVLFHGPVSYNDASNPFVPTYGLNCGSNRLSMMNYLFQVRGFLDNLSIVDYSGQTLAPLDETQLNETNGLNALGFPAAVHFTRWYAPPNAIDLKLGRHASVHCDGSPLNTDAFGNVTDPPTVRVDGSTFSAPLDWNNDLNVPDAVTTAQDVNFNGSTSDPPAALQGFNDWQAIDLRQAGARASALGFSGTGGATLQTIGGGGGTSLQSIGGGGGTSLQSIGGGGGAIGQTIGGGGGTLPQSVGGGGGTSLQSIGGGGGASDQDQNTVCSTADPPAGLTASNTSNKSVNLSWNQPADATVSVGPCRVRRYDVWRATGSFTTLASVNACIAAKTCVFTDIGNNVPPPTPPKTTFTDSNVKNSTTYTYFVTETNAQGVKSGASDPTTITVLFSTK